MGTFKGRQAADGSINISVTDGNGNIQPITYGRLNRTKALSGRESPEISTYGTLTDSYGNSI